MGAFFLYKQDHELDIAAVKKVFQNKGFRQPTEFTFDRYHLLIYQKQLVDTQNWVEDGGLFLGCVGTFVYQGLGYSDSLKRALEDYRSGRLDQMKIRGNFCLLFIDNGVVKILNDLLNVQHLFTDRRNSFLSSSFLAAANAIPGNLTMNRITCIEKLLTGYTIGSDTLFHEIVHLSRSIQKTSEWHFLNESELTVPRSDGRNKSLNILNRANKIREYLLDIEALQNAYSPEIGLSDGYDSRTLYAGTIDEWGKAIAVHTHSTEGARAHDEEKDVVKIMAPALGSDLTVVPTKSMPDYDADEVDAILRDGLYFFDGRCAYNMGAFSPVYTRRYKIATAKDHRLTLNGLGGEMYRNYYMVSKPFINVFEWMKAHSYPSTVATAIRPEDLKEVHRNLTIKITNELGLRWNGYVSNFSMRRFYSEVVMPDCDALNCNAQNQMLFYLTPFIEWDMVRDAYKARNAIGLCGELQAGIMRTLNHDVASYPSHYGFRFTDKPPVKYRMYMMIRGWLPDIIWNARTKHVMKTRFAELDYYRRTEKKSAMLGQAMANLRKVFPEIHFDELLKDYAMMPNAAYTAVLLYELKEKLSAAL